LAIERLLAAAKERPRLGLSLLALLFAVQISPWLYPSVDGCLYLKTVSDFLSAPRLDDFCCLVPPGYPLLIAPAFVFGDRPFLAVSILNWLLAVAMIGGVYVWARRLAPSTPLVLTTAVGVNISLWIFYRRPTKEIATLALLMWTVNAMHRLLDERRMARVMGLTAAVALLTTYLVLIRYAGIMLVLAFAAAAALLVRRGELRPARAVGMSLVIGLVSTSALLLWLVYDRSHGTGGTYVDSIVSIYHNRSVSEPRAHDGDGLDADGQEGEVSKPRHFTRALLYRVNDLTCLTVPGLWKSSSGAGELLSLSTLAGTLVLAVLALGWWKIVSTRIDVLALMLPIYLLLYAHWDSSQPGGRFLLPVLPIIFACVGVGLIAIVRSAAAPAARRWESPVFALYLLAHLGQATGYWLLIDAPRAAECQRNLPIVDRLSDKIQQQAGWVALAPTLEQSCNGLWLALDWKRMRILENPPQRRVEWIVEKAGSDPIAGFSVECVDGPIQLLRREPNREASPERIGTNRDTTGDRL
jgi:hypothetical protein